jgi:predicted RNase H-like HicB family nuclease
MQYAVVIEKGSRNYSAYVPDLPDCVVAGDSVAEVTELMREAIKMHIEGLIEDGIIVPPPSSSVEYIAA